MSTFSLSRPQKDLVSNFQAVTSAPANLAADYLRRYGWSLDHALDMFFGEGHAFNAAPPVPAVDSKKLGSFFRRYAPGGATFIGADGVQALCEEINVDPLDPVTLVIAYYCKAEQMGVFTWEEFAGGMTRLGCDDPNKLKAKVNEELRVELRDRESCKEIYAYTFQFALDKGQRCLPIDTCVELWKLLLPPHFQLLDKWCEFVRENCKNTISKDVWLMLYDLATQVSPDLSDYDTNGAWPVLIDDFVDWARSRQAPSRVRL